MKFDQHFLINQDIIKKTIEEADLKKSDIVLEIGPGKGILTEELVKYSNVIVVEIDKNLKCKNCWKNKERYCRNGIILQN